MENIVMLVAFCFIIIFVIYYIYDTSYTKKRMQSNFNTIVDYSIYKVNETIALRLENEILKSDKEEFKRERNDYRKEVERLKEELSLVI